VIAGASTFGGAWLISIAAAAAFQQSEDEEDAEALSPLFAPLVGPFVTIATADPVPLATFVLALDGVVQGTGLGLFIVGLTSHERIWVRGKAALRLKPLAAAGAQGLVLSGEM
jgi:hypothetical protein